MKTTYNSVKVKLGIKVMKLVESLIGREEYDWVLFRRYYKLIKIMNKSDKVFEFYYIYFLMNIHVLTATLPSTGI